MVVTDRFVAEDAEEALAAQEPAQPPAQEPDEEDPEAVDDPEEECIYFYGHGKKTDPYRVFSNFFPARFTMQLDAVGQPTRTETYVSSEHAIMHQKAVLFGDEVCAEVIQHPQTTPASAKRFGRSVSSYDEAVWAARRGEVALAILRAKFEQNEPLGAVLRTTTPRTLAEAAPDDRVWGIGRTAAAARGGAPWRGTNLLGKTLMAVRDEMCA